MISILAPDDTMPSLKGEFLTGKPAGLPDAAYLILLDQRGVVRWSHGGPFEEEAYRSLAANAAALVGK